MKSDPPTIDYRPRYQQHSDPARRQATFALFALAAACLVLCIPLLVFAYWDLHHPYKGAWDLRGVAAFFSCALAFFLFILAVAYADCAIRIRKFSRAAPIVATVFTAIHMVLACIMLVPVANPDDLIFLLKKGTFGDFVGVASVIIMAVGPAIALFYLVRMLRQRA